MKLYFYNYRYGCIKRSNGCEGKLIQNSENPDIYIVTREHNCNKSDHKNLKLRLVDEIFKLEGRSAPPGTASNNIYKKVESV